MRWPETIRHLLLTGTLLTAFAGPATAQSVWDFGIRGGVYTDDSDPFVGVELLTRMGATEWFFNPNVEVVFPDRGDLITLNADFHYDLPVDAPVYVWVGGGPAIIFRDSDRGPGDDDDETDIGLNLLAGVGFLKGQAVRPYVQGKVVISDESEAVLAFGVRF
jgi:hypothetical protein